MIQLNEHFRCVPRLLRSVIIISRRKTETITTSSPKRITKPALIPVLVEGGYQNTNNKVNEPEAKAIVDKIAELLENSKLPTKAGRTLCTFGVISLLAEDQAKYIKELLLRHPKIGEKLLRKEI